MNLKHLPRCIALSVALFGGQHALANDLMKWQNNSLSYLYGENFNRGQFNTEQDKTQTTFTAEHASGWVWGDIFGFADYVLADNKQSRRGDFGNDKEHFYYFELSPRVSLSWLTGQNLSSGPLKDVFAAFTYEKGDGGAGVENYLYGIGSAWNVPGFAYFNANLYRVKVNNNAYFDRAHGNNNAHTYQLTISGAYPLAIGNQDFVVDGFVDWRAGTSTANTRTSVGSSIQVKWDAGKAMFGEGRKLYVGTEVNMWRNRYGAKPIDGSGHGFDQAAVQALVKYHF
ncbi:nucleoside-binding outer membrane [Pseudomonas lalucatii]|uniref:Nucleoside-binding outer membrane n=1 Tax=Pseudomonas lalucatii TaxID=1424203 RepID=A0ABS5PY72_9PSED|nr:outer membrane protein OmpK [Pseudomonas lalucatii]MBS7660824.1 nucleoside-binding outer membrane [Pseudomonas lalucatii]MBS7691450.1 nucleoside-binding outer membrane [Pseudomonas lalucatii]MBS7724428.1 nucleoside-binding outer membrane [Pseudomonas lalucatii]QVM87582.1 nucleoside-binding outer membrane [Pseudomonas lalucatii]